MIYRPIRRCEEAGEKEEEEAQLSNQFAWWPTREGMRSDAWTGSGGREEEAGALIKMGSQLAGPEGKGRGVGRHGLIDSRASRGIPHRALVATPDC